MVKNTDTPSASGVNDTNSVQGVPTSASSSSSGGGGGGGAALLTTTRSDSTPIVFIHGIKGSFLVDAQTNKTVFLTLPQALGFSTPHLALPMEWSEGEGEFGQPTQKMDNIKPAGILTKVGFVPVYGPFLKKMRQNKERPFYEFAYDWRRDLNETSEHFVRFLHEISQKHSSKVQVIAHSMGGLVTLGAMHHPSNNTGTPTIDLFHSVVFAGCPFSTGIGFLVDLMAGTPNGFNKKILSPDVLSTFPSLYTFFPPKENPKVEDHNGNLLPIDFYDANEWVAHKLGVYSIKEGTNDAQFEHLTRCVSQAAVYREKLKPLQHLKYPPIAVLCSHAHPTLHHLKKTRDGKYDFTSLPKQMGDNRVIDASPPEGIPHISFETKESHSGLLNDTPLVTAILAKLFTM